MGREWEESSEIINAVRENICAAGSRSGISRLKKWYQPTQEVVSADQVNTACRLKKTGSSGIPSDVILMHDVSMLTSLPMQCSHIHRQLIYALNGQQCIAQGNALGRMKWSMRPVGAKASLHISDETKKQPGNLANKEKNKENDANNRYGQKKLIVSRQPIFITLII